jgi:hypothetical protein
MKIRNRSIAVALVGLVVAVALWKGGLTLLLGVVVAGFAWRLLDNLVERDYRARHLRDTTSEGRTWTDDEDEE